MTCLIKYIYIYIWGPKDRGRDCGAVSLVIETSCAQGGNSLEERRRRDKSLLGAPGGKDRRRREIHGK